jgi:hypothetical protein
LAQKFSIVTTSASPAAEKFSIARTVLTSAMAFCVLRDALVHIICRGRVAIVWGLCERLHDCRGKLVVAVTKKSY